MTEGVFTIDRAFLLNDLEINNVASKTNFKCKLLINPGKYLEHSSFTSFGYQKDFALKEIIDYHLQIFKQAGLFKQLEKKYVKPLVQDCEPPIREINFRVVFVAFAILCGGFISALVIFILEKVSFDCKDKEKG